MSKVGVPDVSLVVIPLLAFIFGGKPSTGVLLPMLMMADIVTALSEFLLLMYEFAMTSQTNP